MAKNIIPKTRLGAFALVALAVALTGCGDAKTSGAAAGSSSAPPIKTERLTKSELISRADAICKDMQEQIKAVPPPENIAGLADALAKQIEISQPAIKQLLTLNPPADIADTYDSWTTKMQELHEMTIRARSAAKDGPSGEIGKIVTEGGKIDQQANALGTKLGFKVCVNKS